MATQHKDFQEFHAGLSITGTAYMNMISITNSHTKSIVGSGAERIMNLLSLTGGGFVPVYTLPVGSGDWGRVRDFLITALIALGKDPT